MLKNEAMEMYRTSGKTPEFQKLLQMIVRVDDSTEVYIDTPQVVHREESSEFTYIF